MVLCYTNAEIKGHLRRTFCHYLPCAKKFSQQEASIVTGVTHVSAGRPSVSVGADAALLSTAPNAETHLLAKRQLLNNENNNNSDRRDSDLI